MDSYYTGECSDIDERLLQHNTGFYKGSYTTAATDWQVYLTIECEDRTVARQIEADIKRMKSRKYIENLKKYPEMIEKIKEKGSQSR